MFDYIIVGGGSAGCVLANRLSANPGTRVCLLEAGPPDTSPFVRLPIGIVQLMMSKKLNWQYFTEAQAQLDGRRLFWPRGKTLGGSSSTNAMIYTRGNPSDYDHWAALGNRGWSYADVLPMFRRSEHREGGASDFHGADGALNVAPLRSPNLLSRAFIAAAQEAGYPFNADFNGAAQEGVNCYEVTQKNGERWSAARAFLHPVLQRPNLTVITGARATRLLFEGKRTVGVEYLRAGRLITIDCAREIVLTAGAVNSPHLLMLSGVGAPAALERHGIPVHHDLPGVGQNLQDHLDILVVHQCAKPVSLGVSFRTLPALLKHAFDYLLHRRGPMTSNSAECGGFVHSAPELAIPDLQFHFTPARLDGHARTLRSAWFTLWGHGYALHVCGLRPASRGYIGLKSADPAADPLIEPRYLSDPADLPLMIAAVRAARRVLAQRAMDPYRGAEIFPGSETSSDEEVECFIRRKAETIYHPVGTCKMGRDAMAVVDDTLKVRGLEGLRVADASIMPTLVGGNTNAPVMMIAEKAAEMILADQDRGRPTGQDPALRDAAPAASGSGPSNLTISFTER